MIDPIKFTDEEMLEFRTLSSKYQENLINLGQLYVNRLMVEERCNTLNEEEKKLKSEHSSLQKLEEELLSKITAKYGEGSLEPKSGIFTPIQK